jgi:hypothetical protein
MKSLQVRVTKLSSGGSLPSGYTLSGELVNFVIPGRPMAVDRRERNGMQISGWFQTSNVVSTLTTDEGLEVVTDNGSRYLVQELDEDTQS